MITYYSKTVINLLVRGWSQHFLKEAAGQGLYIRGDGPMVSKDKSSLKTGERWNSAQAYLAWKIQDMVLNW